MPIKYTKEQYEKAAAMISERKSLLAEVSMISAQIETLVKLRDRMRTRARRLKSVAIAHETGTHKAWVDKISEGRINKS